jgi:hypothetical protein
MGTFAIGDPEEKSRFLARVGKNRQTDAGREAS